MSIHRKAKVPKGARDILPEQMPLREKVIDTTVAVLKRHGAVALDTPVFELKETLVGKYGESSKLVYDFADQGGELLSLRYDLTVPFARYIAMHNTPKLKRYQLARVYRRDQPQVARGRYREFYQCDFDIAGTYAPMVPDAEVLKVLTEVLDDLRVGDYEVKLSHRKLLDAMLEFCGVPIDKLRIVCSAIDKLDKESWDDVHAEMVSEKGLQASTADRIKPFVLMRGEPRALLEELRSEPGGLGEHPLAREALADLDTLFDYLHVMGSLKRVTLDLSLARGLDYYTGVIYEAVLKEGTSNVGSIAAGGRYDTLIGMFSKKNMPAVGLSLGMERIFDVIEQQQRPFRTRQTEVLVASIGLGMIKKRMQLCTQLWSAGIKAEFMYKLAPKIDKQLEYALEEDIPLVVLVGDEELGSGTVVIKDLKMRSQANVGEGDLIKEVQARLRSAGNWVS